MSFEEIPEEAVALVQGSGVVRVNASRLRPGILSDYQIASLADYRASHGDILSWDELAMVDGFGPVAVAALKPFLSLGSSRLPGNRDTTRIKATLLGRVTLSQWGLKARVSGSGWRAGGAYRNRNGTFYAEGEGRWGRVLAGDSQLRYGQGLLLWSGFAMESLSGVDAFVRKPSGLTPSWSYSPESLHRALSYEYGARHFRVAAFGALDGLTGAHGDYFWKSGQVGATLIYRLGQASPWGASLDGRWNLRGTVLAWEGAFQNGAFAGKVAGNIPLGETWRLAVQGRAVPSRFSGKKNGEYGVAAGGAFQSGHWRSLAGKSGFGSSVPVHRLSLTADASLLPFPGTDPGRFQLRAYAVWQWQVAPAWAVEMRLTERYRNYEAPRTALRLQGQWSNGLWLATARTEAVWCKGLGVLGYLEAGRKEGTWAAYARITGFGIANWDDRIYVYERDAPGTFSVPAYSGQGGGASLVGSWKHRFGRWGTLRLYLRTAGIWRLSKPWSPTLNFQAQWEY